MAITLVEKDDDGYLLVKEGEKVVGKFLADEVQGWWKVDKGFAEEASSGEEKMTATKRTPLVTIVYNSRDNARTCLEKIEVMSGSGNTTLHRQRRHC